MQWVQRFPRIHLNHTKNYSFAVIRKFNRIVSSFIFIYHLEQLTLLRSFEFVFDFNCSTLENYTRVRSEFVRFCVDFDWTRGVCVRTRLWYTIESSHCMNAMYYNAYWQIRITVQYARVFVVSLKINENSQFYYCLTRFDNNLGLMLHSSSFN